jgi:hypothetical protein
VGALPAYGTAPVVGLQVDYALPDEELVQEAADAIGAALESLCDWIALVAANFFAVPQLRALLGTDALATMTAGLRWNQISMPDASPSVFKVILPVRGGKSRRYQLTYFFG